MNIDNFIDLINDQEFERASLLDEEVLYSLTESQLISLAKLIRDHAQEIYIGRKDDWDLGYGDGYAEGYAEAKMATEDLYESRFDEVLRRTYQDGVDDGRQQAEILGNQTNSLLGEE